MTPARTLAACTLWLPAILLACNGDDEPVDPCDGETDWSVAVGADEEELSRESLGDVSVSDTGGYVDLSVDVPEGAVSTAVHCGFAESALGTVWTLTDPGGTVVYDGTAPYEGNFDTYAYRSDYTDARSAAVLPLSKDVPLSSGTWGVQFFLGAGNGGSASCEAVHRIDEAGSDATVYVNLVFVGPEGLDACTASNDEGFQSALEQFEAEWASAGLTPVYNYLDFDGDKGKYGVVEIDSNDYSEFNDLLRTTAPANERTVTFFFVEEIVDLGNGGVTVLGLSAGPPGVPATNGTSKSGLVISAIDFDSAPTDIGKIMAHEGGHFLGLFHTTEKDGSRHDILSDTPECPPSADANDGGTLSVSECAGQGGENVMFWTLTEGTASFSGDQGWVVRRNPAVD